ncbi:MAG: hypothetical protein ACYDGM_07865, partial [Vulcanimicrobiaceae bacterium]
LRKPGGHIRDVSEIFERRAQTCQRFAGPVQSLRRSRFAAIRCQSMSRSIAVTFNRLLGPEGRIGVTHE